MNEIVAGVHVIQAINGIAFGMQDGCDESV